MSKRRLFSSSFLRRFTSVHSWIGICCGMLLFIAFFAGALTMYQASLQRWSNPGLHQAKGGLRQLDLLIRAAAAIPGVDGNVDLNLPMHGMGPTASVFIESGRAREGVVKILGVDAHGRVVPLLAPSQVAYFINQLHFTAGLPRQAGFTLLGLVSIAYSLALVTGLVIQLPHLVQDLFALRLGKNLKKMWMDAHNVVGVLSLPFHLMFAFTATLLCLTFVLPGMMDAMSPRLSGSHAYASQEHGGRFGRSEDGPGPASLGAPMLTASRLLAIAQAQVPRLEPASIQFRHYGHADAKATVQGHLASSLISSVSVRMAAANGVVGPIDAPAQRSTPSILEGGYIALHYGDFGGEATRVFYLVLGLAGAFLFYSGNLLWIETRRRHRQQQQTRASWLMAKWSVGVCLGSCLGIAWSLLGSRLLPALLPHRTSWEENLYYVGFFTAIIWSLRRPPVRAGAEVLLASALFYLLLPIVDLAGGNRWNDGGTITIDVIMLLLAISFFALGRATARRALDGQANSVWSSAHPAPHPAPAAVASASKPAP